MVKKRDVVVVFGAKNEVIPVAFVEMDIHVYAHQRRKEKQKLTNTLEENIN